MANRKQLYDYKGNKCSHCTLSVKEMLERFGTINRMFQFNHVDPSNKSKNYEKIIERVLSTEQLDEVDKCVLLCNQCHGILHAQNINAELLVRVAIRSKKTEQRFKGQLIVDKLERRATFLTNDRVLVHPYRLSLGGKKPRILFGTELEKGQLLLSFIKKVKSFGRIVLRSWTKREVMRVEYLGGNEFVMSHQIGFQLIQSELFGEDGKPEMWVRNGLGLAKDGSVFRNGIVTYEMSLSTETE
jgi:hypothetical protein